MKEQKLFISASIQAKNKMKNIVLIFVGSLFLLGCETLPESQSDKCRTVQETKPLWITSINEWEKKSNKIGYIYAASGGKKYNLAFENAKSSLARLIQPNGEIESETTTTQSATIVSRYNGNKDIHSSHDASHHDSFTKQKVVALTNGIGQVENHGNNQCGHWALVGIHERDIKKNNDLIKKEQDEAQKLISSYQALPYDAIEYDKKVAEISSKLNNLSIEFVKNEPIADIKRLEKVKKQENSKVKDLFDSYKKLPLILVDDNSFIEYTESVKRIINDLKLAKSPLRYKYIEKIEDEEKKIKLDLEGAKIIIGEYQLINASLSIEDRQTPVRALIVKTRGTLKLPRMSNSIIKYIQRLEIIKELEKIKNNKGEYSDSQLNAKKEKLKNKAIALDLKDFIPEIEKAFLSPKQLAMLETIKGDFQKIEKEIKEKPIAPYDSSSSIAIKKRLIDIRNEAIKFDLKDLISEIDKNLKTIKPWLGYKITMDNHVGRGNKKELALKEDLIHFYVAPVKYYYKKDHQYHGDHLIAYYFAYKGSLYEEKKYKVYTIDPKSWITKDATNIFRLARHKNLSRDGSNRSVLPEDINQKPHLLLEGKNPPHYIFLELLKHDEIFPWSKHYIVLHISLFNHVATSKDELQKAFNSSTEIITPIFKK